MDNEALNEVILDADARQFWIVLWGDPEHSPDEDSQVFNEPTYDQGFAVNPAAIKEEAQPTGSLELRLLHGNRG